MNMYFPIGLIVVSNIFIMCVQNHLRQRWIRLQCLLWRIYYVRLYPL